MFFLEFRLNNLGSQTGILTSKKSYKQCTNDYCIYTFGINRKISIDQDLFIENQ